MGMPHMDGEGLDAGVGVHIEIPSEVRGFLVEGPPFSLRRPMGPSPRQGPFQRSGGDRAAEAGPGVGKLQVMGSTLSKAAPMRFAVAEKSPKAQGKAKLRGRFTISDTRN